MLKLAYLDLREMSAHTFRGLRRVRVLSVENSDLATIRQRQKTNLSFLTCMPYVGK